MPRKKKTAEKPAEEPVEQEGSETVQIQAADAPEAPEEPPKSEAPAVQGAPKPDNDSKELLKWFLIGVAAVLVFGGVYFGISMLTGGSIIDEPKTNLAVIDPVAEMPDEWLLSYERIGLNKIDPAIRAEFLAGDVIDAANWKFQKGKDEAMYVWIRVYPDKQALKENNSIFAKPFSWSHDITRTSFGENGRAAVYKGAQNSKPPLMFYVERENLMLYMAYFNAEGGTNYTSPNSLPDRQMLIELGRVLYDKLELYEGLNESLNTENTSAVA